MKNILFVISSGLFLLLVSSLSAKECNFKITGSDQLQFDLKEIRVPKDCDTIKVTVTTSGKMAWNTMGHNWVLTKTSDWNAVSTETSKAIPPTASYVPKDKRIIAATSYVGGAANDPKEASVTIKKKSLKDSESYHFFCAFPGHFALMNGSFILEK